MPSSSSSSPSTSSSSRGRSVSPHAPFLYQPPFKQLHSCVREMSELYRRPHHTRTTTARISHLDQQARELASRINRRRPRIDRNRVIMFVRAPTRSLPDYSFWFRTPAAIEQTRREEQAASMPNNRSGPRPSPGLDPHKVAAFERVVYDRTEEEEDNDKCVICQSRRRYRQHIFILPCKHRYHVSCARQLFETTKSCAICRRVY